MEKNNKNILSKIEEHEKRINALEQLIYSGNKQKKIIKKTSIKEFLISKKFPDDVKKTLAIGYYLEHFEDMPSFNLEDLKKEFRLAKEQMPKNINDKVNMNIKKGHMTESEKKKNNLKAWELTRTGISFVENNLKK